MNLFNEEDSSFSIQIDESSFNNFYTYVNQYEKSEQKIKLEVEEALKKLPDHSYVVNLTLGANPEEYDGIRERNIACDILLKQEIKVNKAK